MNITGHNSYSGCRFCDIRGVYSKKHNHVYFRPGEYAKKNHSDWFLRINEIEDAETSREKETLIQRYGKSYLCYLCYYKLFNSISFFLNLILGIKGRSILSELKSIKFPRSFPIDIMHLFFENVAPQMFKLWSARFFKDENLNVIPFTVSKIFWEEISTQMQNNKKNMPLEFGRPPRNIFKHYAGYKAEEWANWITLYSVPLLKTYLPDK